jgi:hypothetical protein
MGKNGGSKPNNSYAGSSVAFKIDLMMIGESSLNSSNNAANGKGTCRPRQEFNPDIYNFVVGRGHK